jgi:hypothetical protein
MLLQRQTVDRPSFPIGFGKPGAVARTFTRCGEMRRRFAMSTAITSSVRESTCTTYQPILRPRREGGGDGVVVQFLAMLAQPTSLLLPAWSREVEQTPERFLVAWHAQVTELMHNDVLEDVARSGD